MPLVFQTLRKSIGLFLDRLIFFGQSGSGPVTRRRYYLRRTFGGSRRGINPWYRRFHLLVGIYMTGFIHHCTLQPTMLGEN